MILTTGEQEELRAALRQMCEDNLSLLAAKTDEEARYTSYAHEAFRAVEIMGLTFPEDCGGSAAHHVTCHLAQVLFRRALQMPGA